MGGLISIVMVILFAGFYFYMRATGRKKEAEDDEYAGGAAWVVVIFGGCFLMIILVRYFYPFIEPLNGFLKFLIAASGIGIIFLFASWIVPTKDKDNES